MNSDESFQAGIPACEIRLLFVEAAVRAGLIRPIDQMQVDFVTEIVTLWGRLVDRYPSPECTEDTIGDVIRGAVVRHELMLSPDVHRNSVIFSFKNCFNFIE